MISAGGLGVQLCLVVWASSWMSGSSSRAVGTEAAATCRVHEAEENLFLSKKASKFCLVQDASLEKLYRK